MTRALIRLRLAVVTALAISTTGCPDDGEPGEETSSTGSETGSTDTTSSSDTTSTSTGDTDGSDSSDSSDSSSGTTSTNTTGSESGSTDSDSTGDTESMADCVDEDLGSALGPSVLTGSTLGAGDDYDLDLCLLASDEPSISTSGEDYVVSWTAPENGLYIFSLEGSDFDTVIGVGPLECGAMPVQCNDDCADAESATTYDAAAGQSLLIVIDGGRGAGGAFSLSVTEGTEECYDPQTSTDGG